MRSNEDARHSRVGEKTLDQGAQPLLAHLFAKKYPDGQAVGKRPRGHRSVILPPAMDEDAIHSAAGLQVRLPRGFTMDQGQIVGEPRDGQHRHAMRYENDGHAAFSGCQVERNAVRVAVI
jgi:hypothetical protein